MKACYFRHITALVLAVLLFTCGALAQSQWPGTLGQEAERMSDKLVDIDLNEITLESINFRDQTATLNISFDISNRLVPLKLRDFSYRLSLFDRSAIEGRYDGTMKIGGRRPSRVDLPVTVQLKSIPEVVWSAFSNKGRVRYQLDTGFTLPLLVFTKHVDQSFSGDVSLKSLVDAASLLRAQHLGDGALARILKR